MKRLLLLLSLVMFGATSGFAQISLDSLQEIALEHFEDVVVNQTYKDPYSYELMDVWSEPVSQSELDFRKLELYNQVIKGKGIPKDLRKKYKKISSEFQETIKSRTIDEMHKTVGYDFFIDARGNNSYGNPVLGRYIMTIQTSGKIFSDPEIRN